MKVFRHSLRVKMTVLLISFVTITITSCWLLNSLFLESYYVSKKKPVLTKIYQILNSMEYVERDGYLYGILDEANTLKLQQLCETGGVSLLIEDPSFNMIFRHGIASGVMQKRMLDIMLAEEHSDEIVLEQEENYRLVSLKDDELNINYLELSGVLESGNLFIMRVAMENIQESALVSNRFLFYVGSAMTLICSIIMYVITRNFTQPILNLAALSKKMSDLDFSAKYKDVSGDELDVLGNNMNQLSEKLEKTISQLKQANLELQRDIAKKEEIDAMRKEFVSNVSHELKTPIALIQGYAEGLQEGISDDAESREFYCSVIMDEANKMNKLVKNLLSLNQLEFGSQAIEMECFNLIEIISAVLNSNAIVIEQKQVKVFFDDAKEVMVWADEFQIEQVLTNYISNALHHIDYEKELHIDVVLRDNRVRVNVMNTGNQIPQEDLSRLWDKFYKVDKARTREYGGSGIGLSIVKAIMEKLNQNYGVENVSNGVVFWFELDLAKSDTIEK